MMALLDAKKTWSICFSILITHLWHKTGNAITSLDPIDCIRLQSAINEKLFAPGEKVKRGQRQEATEEDGNALEFGEIKMEYEDADDFEYREENDDDVRGENPSNAVIDHKLVVLSAFMESVYLTLNVPFNQLLNVV